MMIGALLGFVIVLLALIFAAVALFAKRKAKKIASIVAGVLVLVMLIALATVPMSFHTVEAGEIAVVKNLGRIKGVREAGTHFDFWMTNTYSKYDAKVQNVDISAAAYSSDAQTMTIAMTLQYQIMTDKVMDIATQYGSLDVLENRIQSIAIEKTKSVLSSYKAMDIIADRAAISPAVEDSIKTSIGDEYFVNVVTVVLTNIDFSDAFELAVEEKMIAEQAKLKADYENQTKVAQAEAEAEAKLKAAQAEIEIAKAQADAKLKAAEAQIEIAKAEAEALKIAANAEAEANKIISDSLTQQIIDKTIVENWDGKLPTVMGSGEYILPSEIFESEKETN